MSRLEFGIESLWVAFLLFYGVVPAIMFLIGFLFFLFGLMARCQARGWVVLGYYFLVNSTFLGIAGKSTSVTTLSLMLLLMLPRHVPQIAPPQPALRYGSRKPLPGGDAYRLLANHVVARRRPRYRACGESRATHQLGRIIPHILRERDARNWGDRVRQRQAPHLRLVPHEGEDFSGMAASFHLPLPARQAMHGGRVDLACEIEQEAVPGHRIGIGEVEGMTCRFGGSAPR